MVGKDYSMQIRACFGAVAVFPAAQWIRGAVEMQTMIRSARLPLVAAQVTQRGFELLRYMGDASPSAFFGVGSWSTAACTLSLPAAFATVPCFRKD
jgi:hypothetical protein